MNKKETIKNSEYSENTLDIISKISKIIKKNEGIFITPLSIIKKLIEYIPKTTINNILEPSFGTCEFIKYIDNYYQNVNIVGVELNKLLFENSKTIKFNNNVDLSNENFLTYNKKSNFDLIIGNPPFVVCKRDDIPQQYQNLIYGRPNLFCLFIIHSLELLNDNGILAFVIPKSFLNSFYYDNIRKLLIKTGNILNIVEFNKSFVDTDQETFGLIFQKTKNLTLNFIYNINGCSFFSPNNKLSELFNNSTTLKNLGLNVKTGNLVWNQHKKELTYDNTKTLLIYNSNIVKKKLCVKQFTNKDKQQYINIEGYNDIVIVANRGNGNSKYKLNFCIIDIKEKYLVENHLNVIYNNKISKEELMDKFNIIVKSFNNPKTKEFIDIFLGNNGLSKTELENIFPIYL